MRGIMKKQKDYEWQNYNIIFVTPPTSSSGQSSGQWQPVLATEGGDRKGRGKGEVFIFCLVCVNLFMFLP